MKKHSYYYYLDENPKPNQSDIIEPVIFVLWKGTMSA